MSTPKQLLANSFVTKYDMDIYAGQVLLKLTNLLSRNRADKKATELKDPPTHRLLLLYTAPQNLTLGI